MPIPGNAGRNGILHSGTLSQPIAQSRTRRFEREWLRRPLLSVNSIGSPVTRRGLDLGGYRGACSMPSLVHKWRYAGLERGRPPPSFLAVSGRAGSRLVLWRYEIEPWSVAWWFVLRAARAGAGIARPGVLLLACSGSLLPTWCMCRLPVSLPVRSPGAVGCGGSDLRRRGCERNAAIAGLSAGKPGRL